MQPHEVEFDEPFILYRQSSMNANLGRMSSEYYREYSLRTSSADFNYFSVFNLISSATTLSLFLVDPISKSGSPLLN